MESINYEVLELEEPEKDLTREYGTIVHYSKGQIIFATGDTADRIYLTHEAKD